MFGSTALAADPPDTQVNVGVVTPGNVDLNVGINAGGNTNVTVDGTNMQQVANTANAAYDRAYHVDSLGDLIINWKVSGLQKRVEGSISDLQNISSLIINAQAKLIQDNKDSNTKISSIESSTSQLSNAIDSNKKEIDTTISHLQTSVAMMDTSSVARDNKAEVDIHNLQQKVNDQNDTIGSLQTQQNYLTSKLDEVQSLNRRYMILLTIAVGLLLVWVAVLSLRKH